MGTALRAGTTAGALVKQLLNHRYFQAHGTGRPDLRFHDLRNTGQTLALRPGRTCGS